MKVASYWLSRVPKKRRPDYPRHRGHLAVQVAIVGGGLTGCFAAYSFATAGVRVALLEAGRIGEAGTAGSLGLLLTEPSAAFPAIVERYGVRAARRMWQGWRKGALDLAATLRRLRIRCELSQRDLLEVAITLEDERRLRRAYEVRREADLEVTWLPGAALRRATRIEAYGAARTRDSARLDPYRAAVGLAGAAATRGAQIFQQTTLVRARPGTKAIEIITDGGTVSADTMVIATGLPGPACKSLRRHFRETETYAVLTETIPASMRKEIGTADVLVRDTAVPAHHLLRTADDRLMFGGADQAAPPARLRERTLVQRSGQLMYELSLLYPAISGLRSASAWSARLAQTVDGLPFIGPHRHYPRHLFALGSGATTLGSAGLAGRLLVRHYLGEPAKGDDLFDFRRLGG